MYDPKFKYYYSASTSKNILHYYCSNFTHIFSQSHSRQRVTDRAWGRKEDILRQKEKMITIWSLYITWPSGSLDLVDENTLGAGGGRQLMCSQISKYLAFKVQLRLQEIQSLYSLNQPPTSLQFMFIFIRLVRHKISSTLKQILSQSCGSHWNAFSLSVMSLSSLGFTVVYKSTDSYKQSKMRVMFDEVGPLEWFFFLAAKWFPSFRQTYWCLHLPMRQTFSCFFFFFFPSLKHRAEFCYHFKWKQMYCFLWIYYIWPSAVIVFSLCALCLA